jgi:hypothetical protein
MLNLFASLNYLEVIVSGVAYFMLGWIWYSFLFTKPWMKEMGMKEPKNMTKEEQQEMSKGMMPTMALSLLTSIIFALVIGLLQIGLASANLIDHLINGLLIWIALLGGPTLLTALYSMDKRLKLWAINYGYPLAGILLLNILMFYWI